MRHFFGAFYYRRNRKAISPVNIDIDGNFLFCYFKAEGENFLGGKFFPKKFFPKKIRRKRKMKPKGKERIVVALDVDSVDKAIELVKELRPYVGYFKIGLELIYTMLASIVDTEDEYKAIENLKKIRQLFALVKGKLFLDTKLNDISNTIDGATKALSRLGLKMFNIHATSGKAAIIKAVVNKGEALAIGVTVLTSIDEEESVLLFGAPAKVKVAEFAQLVKEAGGDGIVCSPQELKLLRSMPEFKDLMTVVPGVRPKGAAVGDQKRVMTPFEAIVAGATFLVIGRPITRPESGTPIEAAQRIAKEIRCAEILELEEATIEELLELADAFWVYTGKTDEPHALLASKKHSDGYINLNAILMFPNASEILARNLITKLKEKGIALEEIGAVASSTFAGFSLGQEVARQLGVMFVFTEKDGEEQKWGGRFELPQGTKILQVEDFSTTVGTPRKVRHAVLEANPTCEFVQLNGKTVLAAAVYRPDKLPTVELDYEVISLLELAIRNWTPEVEECLLCKQGSIALKPKENWEKFPKISKTESTSHAQPQAS